MTAPTRAPARPGSARRFFRRQRQPVVDLRRSTAFFSFSTTVELLAEDLRVEKVLHAETERSALSAYAGPMPRFVVPSLFFPSRRSVSASSSWWYGRMRCALPLTQESAAVDALLVEPSSSASSTARVDHDAVADDRRDVVVEDAAGHQLQRERLTTYDNRVPGVVPALVADDDLHLLGDEVSELALALIAPLRRRPRPLQAPWRWY